MKITRRQLRRIIREEYENLPQKGDKAEEARLKAQRDAARLPDMSAKTANAIQLLQTVNMNLQDIMANTRGHIYDDINEQLELLEDAIHALGGVV